MTTTKKPVAYVAGLLCVASSAVAACGGGGSSLDALIESSPTRTVNTALPTQPPSAASEPTATTTPESGVNGAREYVVQEGDTLGAIAEEFGVTVDAIAQANDIADANLITVGQTLQIPAAE